MDATSELRKVLNDITDSEPEDAHFLEANQEREKAYSNRSVQRWQEVIRILLETGTNKHCLDIGTSPLTFALKKWCTQVDTLDVTNHFESRCRKEGIRLYLPGTAWLDNVPDETYDSIIFLEVIEHLHMNPEEVLRQLQRKIRKGGVLVVSTPNLMCFGNRIRVLTNQKLLHLHYPPFKPSGLHGHGHDRIYTPAEMAEYFQNTGWTSFRAGYHGVAVSDGFENVPFWKKPLYLPVFLMKHLLPSTRQLMLFVARK